MSYRVTINYQRTFTLNNSFPLENRFSSSNGFMLDLLIAGMIRAFSFAFSISNAAFFISAPFTLIDQGSQKLRQRIYLVDKLSQCSILFP